MTDIPMKTSEIYNYTSIGSLNRTTQHALSSQNILALGHQVSEAAPAIQTDTIPSQTSMSSIQNLSIPPLMHRIQKGQKVPLASGQMPSVIDVCLGWNVKNPACDIDVSAFILNEQNKVLGDDWFVFYGQPLSPDKAVTFFDSSSTDREHITIDFTRLNPYTKKIVFVLTINEAYEKHLNFSMVDEAYIRILDPRTHTELVSFQMTDYYSNVFSMMIGEIYLHNGIWKCNAIGNGVSRDLAGLCELYGVQIID